jgi:hypothetical protein
MLGTVSQNYSALCPTQLLFTLEMGNKMQIKPRVRATHFYSTSQVTLKVFFESLICPSLQIFYRSVAFKLLVVSKKTAKCTAVKTLSTISSGFILIY